MNFPGPLDVEIKVRSAFKKGRCREIKTSGTLNSGSIYGK